MPNLSDSRHVYVGSIENPEVPGTTFDVYQIYDASANRVLEWKVNSDDLSGNVVNGSMRDIGPPSRYSVAQAPAPAASATPPPSPTLPAPTPATPPPAPPDASTLPPAAPSSFNAPVSQGTGTGTPSGVVGGPLKGDPSHVYVGRNSVGDAWQLIDAGGNVIEWYVPAGGDSRGPIIAGTTRNLGAPSQMTVAKGPATPSASTGSGSSGSYNAPPPPASVSNVRVGPISDPRHTYVSRDENGDRWRVVDEGGNVVEWYTLPGAASGNVIAGTQRYTGAAGTPTGSATTSTTPPSGAPNTPAPAGAAAPGISLAVIAGLAIQLLK
jgi:hypothetical protein